VQSTHRHTLRSHGHARHARAGARARGGRRGQAGAARTRAPGRRGRAASPSPSGGPGRRPAVPCARARGPRTLRSGSPLDVVLGRAPARGFRRDSGCLGTRRSPLPPPSSRRQRQAQGAAVTALSVRRTPASCVPSLRLRFGVPARDVRTRHALSRLVRLDSLCSLVSRVSSYTNHDQARLSRLHSSRLMAGRGDPSALCVTFNII
jgi:hypothetical protein